jgi:monooxygenase
LVREHLGPDYDIETHFTPRYNPWDQRLCLVPDADLFDSIKAGPSSVVTDQIETFTETGIQLKSGQPGRRYHRHRHGPAHAAARRHGVVVDGRKIAPHETTSYKGMMFSDVPNLASTFGYTNASWTLKADLTAEYVCRLLNHMDRTGARICTPHLPQGEMEIEPWLDFSSGYVQRALKILPKQGTKTPWKVHQNYALDLVALRYGKVDDGTMAFSKAKAAAPAKAAA